jgi:hypothetical protein
MLQTSIGRLLELFQALAPLKSVIPLKLIQIYASKHFAIQSNNSSQKLEQTHYIPDTYYLDKFGYDFDMYKKCWKNDFKIFAR